MKKGQVSLEFIVVIAIVVLISVFFIDLVFSTTNTTKSVAKIKLKTLDLITVSDSSAVLLNIGYVESTSDLNFTLYLKNGSELNLSDANYQDVIENIRATTNYQNIDLSFVNN